MILILCGKSASGKDTILNDFIQDGFVHKIISYTTRPKRTGEVNGVDYNFVTERQFIDMLNEGLFFETRSYNTLQNGYSNTWYYGSKKIDMDMKSKIHYGAIMDMNGVRDYVNEYGKENVFVVYVDVPDELRKQRCVERGSFDETEWNRRLEDDAKKFDLTNPEVSSLINLVVENTEDIRDVKFEISYAFYNYIMDKYKNENHTRFGGNK